MRTTLISIFAALGILVPVIASAASLSDLGSPISESYRAMFKSCDDSNKFGPVQLPILKADGKIAWYGCKSDPNRLDRFAVVAKTETSPSAVILISKLGHDEDGSAPACHHAEGPTDQCGTTLMLKPTDAHPCLVSVSSGRPCVPVDPDQVAYVVIPGAAPKGIDAHQFEHLSGLSIGDYGVVIYKGKTVPVILADLGPAYKFGEGSTALLKQLSADGKVHTIGSGATFVLFPGSRVPASSLSPDDLKDVVAKQGASLYDAFEKAH